MSWDAVLTALVVAAAVVYLVRRAWLKRVPACAACIARRPRPS
jgi:hypothetical protein